MLSINNTNNTNNNKTVCLHMYTQAYSHIGILELRLGPVELY